MGLTDDDYYDTVYDAWKRGLNSDLVDRERMDYDLESCESVEECQWREIQRIRPKRVLY